MLSYTVAFIQILVHGEMNEMNRLKAGIVRQYEDVSDFKIEVCTDKMLAR